MVQLEQIRCFIITPPIDSFVEWDASIPTKTFPVDGFHEYEDISLAIDNAPEDPRLVRVPAGLIYQVKIPWPEQFIEVVLDYELDEFWGHDIRSIWVILEYLFLDWLHLLILILF